MSDRVSYLFVVIFLLVAAGLRLWSLNSLPAGLSPGEITQARIIETARQGRVELLYEVDNTGFEGLYGTAVSASTALTGPGQIGYRLPSVFVGLLTLAQIYALGKRLFGTEAGFAALAMLAVNMFPILLSRSVLPHMLLPLLVTSVMLALARALPIYGSRPLRQPDTAPFAALGALLGLSLYVHPSGFLLILIAVLLIIAMVILRQPFSQRTFSQLWFTLVVAIVLATPYLISSLQNPELAGAGRVITIAPRPLEALVNNIGALIFVGDLHPEHNLPGRPMFDLISGLFIVLGAAVVVRGWRQPRFLLILIALLVLLPLLLGSTEAEFRQFAPLLPVLALLFGLGVAMLYRSLPRQPRTARRLMLGAMITLVIFNLQWTARDLFITWPNDPAVRAALNARISAIANHLDRSADDIPTVVCSSTIAPVSDAMRLTTPQRLGLLMHNRDLLLRYADCGRALILPNGGGYAQIALAESDSIAGVHPYVRTWLGQGMMESLPFTNPTAPSLIRLDVSTLLADTIGAFTTTAPVTFAPESPGGAQLTALPVRFGGNLTFLGDVRNWETQYRPGDFVSLITYWRVDGPLPPDLNLFAHVLSDPAAIVAQSDGIAVVPAQLQPRDIFIQVIFIQLPYTMPDGEYSISIGAYERGSGVRLAVYDDTEPRGSRLFLGTITIQR